MTKLLMSAMSDTCVCVRYFDNVSYRYAQLIFSKNEENYVNRPKYSFVRTIVKLTRLSTMTMNVVTIVAND